MKASNIILTLGIVYLVYKLTNKIPVVSKIDQSIINSKITNITPDPTISNNRNLLFPDGTFEYYQPQTVDFKQLVPSASTVLNYQPSPIFKPSYVC